MRRGSASARLASAAAAVLALTACESAASEPDGSRGGIMPYLPDSMVDAPRNPPDLHVGTPEGTARARLIAADWNPGSGTALEAPASLRWPSAAAPRGSLDFSFSTPQVPVRVVVYQYPGVDSNGIPAEEEGTETICGWNDPDLPCSREGDGEEDITVTVDPLPRAGDHFVLHAAWKAPVEDQSRADPEIVSASWVIRLDGMDGGG
ncbi:hypothetical protein [Salininema proteolyticum]|uniref:Lipoprotein n=1 Tax=Salininema proteolyticum TaxID=1607685 RepID=A0ABV8U1X7_9ACTN